MRNSLIPYPSYETEYMARLRSKIEKMSDSELKLELVKMLPDEIMDVGGEDAEDLELRWKPTGREIKDSEWLQVCHLAEETLTNHECDIYSALLSNYYHNKTGKEAAFEWSFHRDWQQKARELLKTKRFSTPPVS